MQQYLDLATSTGAFTSVELEVLEGVLDDYLHFPSEGYIIFDERIGAEVIGFIVFARSPLTAYGWDIYWLAVRKEYQGKGYGKLLVQRVEGHIQDRMKKAILRVETSSQNLYAHARNLYMKLGFKRVGVIEDFYSEGDDNIIFYKNLVAQKEPVCSTRSEIKVPVSL